MKYNILMDYREELEREYTKATATTYYKAMDYLLNDQFLVDIKDMDIDRVLSRLNAIKYKSQFSKYKNAFIKFCDFLNMPLNKKTLMELDGMGETKKKKYRKLKAVRLIDVRNRIKTIHNKRLRLSYQVMLATGLRVAEIAQVRKEDCTMMGDRLVLNFIGKGGKKEQVCVANKNLVKNLTTLIDDTSTDKPVFYSANFLQKEAKKREFQTHDLRRAFAKISYSRTRNLNETMKLMRHTKFKSTKIYLNSKVKI